MLWSIDTCQNKVSADLYTWLHCELKFRAPYVCFWSWPLFTDFFSIVSRAEARLQLGPSFSKAGYPWLKAKLMKV